MTNISPEARDYLKYLLALAVTREVDGGRGDQPMSPEWTELHSLAVFG